MWAWGGGGRRVRVLEVGNTNKEKFSTHQTKKRRRSISKGMPLQRPNDSHKQHVTAPPPSPPPSSPHPNPPTPQPLPRTSNAPVELVLSELSLHAAECECLVHGVCELLRVPRIHADGAAQGLRAAGELAEDEHARPVVVKTQIIGGSAADATAVVFFFFLCRRVGDSGGWGVQGRCQGTCPANLRRGGWGVRESSFQKSENMSFVNRTVGVGTDEADDRTGRSKTKNKTLASVYMLTLGNKPKQPTLFYTHCEHTIPLLPPPPPKTRSYPGSSRNPWRCQQQKYIRVVFVEERRTCVKWTSRLALRRNVLVRHQVHPVPHRRHQTHVRHVVDGEELVLKQRTERGGGGGSPVKQSKADSARAVGRIQHNRRLWHVCAE